MIDSGFIARLCQSHPIEPMLYEEDTLGMMQAQYSCTVATMLGDEESLQHAMNEEGKDHMYNYVKLLWQVLASKYGPEP